MATLDSRAAGSAALLHSLQPTSDFRFRSIQRNDSTKPVDETSRFVVAGRVRAAPVELLRISRCFSRMSGTERKSQPLQRFVERQNDSAQQQCGFVELQTALFKGERASTPALPLFHSFRNSFHSAMPWALRRSAVTGSSFGARGTLSSFKPASCGRRLPLRVFTCLLDHTRFSHVSGPPRERGTTWSRLPSSGRSNAPVYWQRLPSRSRMARAQSFGRFLGTRA